MKIVCHNSWLNANRIRRQVTDSMPQFVIANRL